MNNGADDKRSKNGCFYALVQRSSGEVSDQAMAGRSSQTRKRRRPSTRKNRRLVMKKVKKGKGGNNHKMGHFFAGTSAYATGVVQIAKFICNLLAEGRANLEAGRTGSRGIARSYLSFRSTRPLTSSSSTSSPPLAGIMYLDGQCPFISSVRRALGSPSLYAYKAHLPRRLPELFRALTRASAQSPFLLALANRHQHFSQLFSSHFLPLRATHLPPSSHSHSRFLALFVYLPLHALLLFPLPPHFSHLNVNYGWQAGK